MGAKTQGAKRSRAAATDAAALSTIRSGVRILRLLEYFSRIDEEVTVMQVARTLDLPQSSTSALLARLVEHGYVAHDPWRRVYSPSARLALIGMELAPKLPYGNRIIDLMGRLSELTDGTVFLSSHNQTTMQTVHVVRPGGKPASPQSLGCKYPLVSCTPGRVFLSLLPEAKAQGFIRRHNAEARKPGDRVDVRPFVAELARVRATGYAISQPDEPVPAPVNSDRQPSGQCCLPRQNRLAVSLPGLSSQAALVLTVGCPPNATAPEEQRFAEMIKDEVHARFAREGSRSHHFGWSKTADGAREEPRRIALGR